MLPPGIVRFVFSTSEPRFRYGKIWRTLPYSKRVEFAYGDDIVHKMMLHEVNTLELGINRGLISEHSTFTMKIKEPASSALLNSTAFA